MPVSQTPLLITFNLFLLVLLNMLTRRARIYPYKISTSNRRLAICTALFFALFSFWGLDWFHYLAEYPRLKMGDSGQMEEVYSFIAKRLSFGYITFRLIVWGAALWMYCLLIRRLSINTSLALFFFLSLWLIWFSYARASLAMVMVFLGYSYLYKPFKYTFVSVVIGSIFILSSIFFHKSAVFAILITFIALIGEYINKKLFAIFVIVLAITVPSFLSSYITEFMSLDSFDIDVMSESVKKGQLYLEEEETVLGLGPMLQRILEVGPYYILALISYIMLLKDQPPRSVAVNMRIIILIVLFSSLLSFDYGLNTSVMYIRFMRFSFIPSSIVMSYLWSNSSYKRMTKATYAIALLGTFYTVFYSLYCCVIGH